MHCVGCNMRRLVDSASRLCVTCSLTKYPTQTQTMAPGTCMACQRAAFIDTVTHLCAYCVTNNSKPVLHIPALLGTADSEVNALLEDPTQYEPVPAEAAVAALMDCARRRDSVQEQIELLNSKHKMVIVKVRET